MVGVNGTSVGNYAFSKSIQLDRPLVAYFTQESVDFLRSIEDIPQLANLTVPAGMYKSARSAKGRPRDNPQGYDQQYLYNVHAQQPQQPQYVPYPIGGGHMSDSGVPSNGWTDGHLYRDDSQYQPRMLSQSKSGEALAPLAYLENIPPPRRHPLDEKALMSFSPGFH